MEPGCARSAQRVGLSHVHVCRNLARLPLATKPCVKTLNALPEIITSIVQSPQRDLFLIPPVAASAILWVKTFNLLKMNGVLHQNLSRKLVHTTAGPLFVATWPLFSMDPGARFCAAVIPALNALRLIVVGSGLVKDDAMVKSVSRSGNRAELLGGPLYYCFVLIGATLFCWRDNPAGMIAISLMCGGDGLADIIGRKFGKSNPLPYNTNKSFAGSLAMFVGGLAMSALYISVFCSLGYYPCYTLTTLLPPLLLICLAATLLESLPINTLLDDNISVPILAAGMALALLPTTRVAVAALAVPSLISAAL